MTDVLKDAQLLFNESLDVMRAQRQQMEEDVRFSNPSDPQQWDEQVKRSRENDAGGARPCLVLDQINQYVANVAGQVEAMPPSLHAIPVGNGASKQAAEQLDGRFRHIEQTSRASQHYARAMTSAARTGVGYLTVRPEYTNRALGYQEPRIGSEPDSLRVILDPWSTETDGSDANDGWILTPMSITAFKSKFGDKREAKDFGDTCVTRNNDERKQIMLAEHWCKSKQSANIIVYTGADGQDASGTEEEYHAACQAAGMTLEFIRNFKESKTVVNWRRYSGAEVLEDTVYQSDYIGIVPVYGYVGFVDGRMTYCGLPRRARHAQQAYNYHVSEQLAYSIAAPKSPWLISARAAAGYENILSRTTVESRGYIPFNDWDENGAINTPTRVNTSTNAQIHSEGAAQALRDIQAALGMYQSTLGAQGNETSAIAIEARNKQSSASTSHFPAHMAASLGQVGRIVMQMDARLTDTRRSHTTVAVDGAVGKYNVDPEQAQSFERTDDGVSVNPSVGEYDVRIVVGASYATQRSQTNAAFAEIMRGNPELAQTVAPFWAQTLDFAGSDKFAQAMAAMSPPPVKAILQPEGKDDDKNNPQKLAQQLQDMQQAMEQQKQILQETIQHAHDAQADADQAISDLAEAKRMSELKERENDIKAYEAETKRMQAVGVTEDQAKIVMQGLLEEALKNPLPYDGEEPNIEQPQEQEPAQPSPEMQALLQGHAQLADGHAKLTDAVGQLINYTKAPRKNTAVRDQNGDIIHTIQSIEEPPQEPQEPQEMQ